MTIETLTSWKPGMDLPYGVPLGDGSMLAITLQGAWLKPDRSGKPLLLPPAVRALDRLRAVFADQPALSPAFILSLREAMALTQTQFARKLGVSKITVSRWECGRIRPGPALAKALFRLQRKARSKGVRIDGDKRTAAAAAQRYRHAS